jgi:hypothetical protein
MTTMDNGWEAEMWFRGIQAFMDYKGVIEIDGVSYHHGNPEYNDKSLYFFEIIGVDALHKHAKKLVPKKKWTDALFKDDDALIEPFLKEFLHRIYRKNLNRRRV